MDDKTIKLKIWNTALQKRIHSIPNGMIKNLDGIILVYDVSNERSFSKIKELIQSIDSDKKRDIPLVLLGNKCDIVQRSVSEIDGIKMAKDLNIRYYETSASTGKGINEAFEHLAKEIMEKKDNVISGRKSYTLKSSTQRIKNKKGCYSYSN